MENKIIISELSEIKKIIDDTVRDAISKMPSPTDQNEKLVFTNKQAMEFLGVSRSTLQRWREDGILPYRKINGTILYTSADLREMLENNKS